VAPETGEELLALRRKCATVILDLFPSWLMKRYFGRATRQTMDTSADSPDPDLHGGDKERVLAEIEEGILDVFSDEYCNKHLMYGALELILVRLMPELAEKGVVDLWAERLS